jgi:hypothetical protein
MAVASFNNFNNVPELVRPVFTAAAIGHCHPGAALEPVPSVTEHTTRSFEPVPVKTKTKGR